LREAESTINDMTVQAAASEREVALLRAQLAQQKQASYEAGSDDEQQPAAQQLSARYRDLGLGFHVASLTDETDRSATQEPMLATPTTTAQAQHYKDLQLGFAVSSLSMDF
jgi:N-methylhydantoinase B/oxoprolinase/acetone carboxylase alpha subunit